MTEHVHKLTRLQDILVDTNVRDPIFHDWCVSLSRTRALGHLSNQFGHIYLLSNNFRKGGKKAQ